HTTAVDRRDVSRRAGVWDLCGHLVFVGHARAGAPDLRLHPLRGRALERAGSLLQELDPRGAEGFAASDRPTGDPRAVHAPDLIECSSLREHARVTHSDPALPGADLHLP